MTRWTSTNRRLAAVLPLALGVALLAGCEGGTGPEGMTGPTGPAGPQGPEGGPGPVSMLVTGTDSQGAIDAAALAIFGEGNFVSGSDVAAVSYTTAPALADLTPYDVVVAYSNFGTPTGLGDVLADYVDAGGRVVLAQGLFTTGFELDGRMVTDAYTPFGAAAGASDGTDRMFDVTSIALPPHPVFTGVNVNTWTGTGLPSLSDPPLVGSATLLAAYSNGHNAVAINAAGTVIGLNIYAGFGTDVGAAKLLANAVLFLAGEL